MIPAEYLNYLHCKCGEPLDLDTSYFDEKGNYRSRMKCYDCGMVYEGDGEKIIAEIGKIDFGDEDDS